ncbi:MAG: GNAT family N-acetyltransferase [Chloroflexi bacterium]|nr:GNAT family N-acetyltransferase [Chloroflexota bacterium]
MALATWWKNDPLPLLRPLANFTTGLANNHLLMARLNRLPIDEVRQRLQAGHRPYIGYWEGQPVAYGWVATESASIGELDLEFALPSGDRYLWDFATLPEFQGRGIYPHLLQGIMHTESREAERFWILYAPENLPSGAGMGKAGLLPVGQLSFQADGRVGLTIFNDSDRAAEGAKVFGVPLVQTILAPCWHCGMLMEQTLTDEQQLCWPPSSMRATNTTRCTCAIEIRPSV